ncbi:MAG: Fe-S cluster assembly protein SufD [Bacteroidota bacterium]|nr:Fe-S cluster assembly protein SufD [Bacteroidota bacterium]
MPVSNKLQNLIQEEFQRFENQINGESLSEVQALRKIAFADFLKNGLPNSNDEEWKYTNLDSIQNLEFRIHNPSHLSDKEINNALFKEFDHNRIVFLNGVYSEDHSLFVNKNIEVVKINQIPTGQSSLLSLYTGQYKAYNSDGFIHLNNSFFKNGVFVNVGFSKENQLPLVFYYLTDAKDTNNLSLIQNKIVINENATVEIFEHFVKIGDNNSLTDCIFEIFINENANVSYNKILNEGIGASHVGTTQVNQIGQSVFNSSAFIFSGEIVRNNLNVTLLKQFSESHLFGLNLITGNTIADNHTVVDHKVPNCPSNETYKAVVDQHATSVFNGKIFVRPDAQKTNAFQSSKTILLSNEANSFSKPQLEIWADDVKCSHGHATGQLDKEALFYLKSRGIGEKSATSMLTKAFAMDILNSVKNEYVKSYLTELVENRFES